MTTPAATKKQMLDFIASTVKHYGRDPANLRGVNPTSATCTYLSSDGKKCAIGRHLSRDVLESCCQTVNPSSGSQEFVWSRLPHDALPADHRLKKFNPDFLREAQLFHDRAHNWNVGGNGLSSAGKDAIRDFRQSIKNGRYSAF